MSGQLVQQWPDSQQVTWPHKDGFVDPLAIDEGALFGAEVLDSQPFGGGFQGAVFFGQFF